MKQAGYVTQEEWKQIAKGVAVFVGGLTVAALLKSHTPWAQRNKQVKSRPASNDAGRPRQDEVSPEDD